MIIGIIFFIFLFIVLRKKIIYKKTEIKIVLGEMCYGYKNQGIIYDFSKYEKYGIVGMNIFSTISKNQMRDEIAEGTFKRIAQEHPNLSSQEIFQEIGNMEIKIPHYFIMKNANLLINRFTKKQIIEGVIDQWIP